MCGIVGKVCRDTARPVDRDVVERMSRAVAHRGPDGQGRWFAGPAGFGFRRLAIIDLVTGDQPMVSDDGAAAIVFNGEIYNHRELRARLEGLGHTFRTRSDTEAILRGYLQWGTGVAAQLRGMFAFAVFDARTNELLLARDRLGKKPLHYAVVNRGMPDEALVFASEVRALLCEPSLGRRLDLQVFSHLLTYEFVPDPFCILEGVLKVPAAHVLVYRDGQVTAIRYWELAYDPKLDISEEDAVDALRAELDEAVRLRLVGDVPVGAYLSAGMDAATVVAMARRHVPGRMTTVSAALDGHPANELAAARLMADRYDTDHHELVIRPDPAECLSLIPWHYGEPNAQPSAVAFLYLHRFAAGLTKVMLGGDGGDENFVGYHSYWRTRPHRSWRRLPRALRAAIATPLDALSAALPSSGRARTWAHRNRSSLLSGEEVFIQNYSVFSPVGKRAIVHPALRAFLGAGLDSSPAITRRIVSAPEPSEQVDRFMLATWHMHMAGTTFPKADRLAMAHGLEVRSPLCDHRVTEFAARLPVGVKFRGNRQKHILRELAEPLLPPAFASTRKIGFGTPPDDFFGKHLRSLAYELISDPRFDARQLFDPRHVRTLFDQHFSGTARHRNRVWLILIIETWCRTFLDRADPLGGPVAF
jgi:asparagine synthase (glutamine-hydrolysing)